VVDLSPENDLIRDWNGSAIKECVSSRDASLLNDIARATDSLPVHNVFNPSFYLDDAVKIVSFRAIGHGDTEIHSYISIEDHNGHSIQRLCPSDYPGLRAPRLIDPKIVRLGDACFTTFNSGWVPEGNDIFIMKIWPERAPPRRMSFPGRARQERNWAFFSVDGEIYALYWINPTRVLRLSYETADSWVMEPCYENDSPIPSMPTDLTIGTQMSPGQRYHYFVAHQKRYFANKKVYLGRLCRFDSERLSVSTGRYWLSHSMDSIRGSRIKHNTNLYSCTYFSGLQVQDDLIRIGYGVNDIDYGASIHDPSTL
jgi:hypothetical protein